MGCCGGGKGEEINTSADILSTIPYGTRAATGDVGCGFRGDVSLR